MTGRRLKGQYDAHSIASKLNLKFVHGEAFFGEHLLRVHPDSPVAIVEAEKTAIIATICGPRWPEMVWLATGSKQSLKKDRLERIGKGRRIILFPDADGFVEWGAVAKEAVEAGLDVRVSDLIESRATAAEKADGADLADYLIREQSNAISAI
jgi:hypothetical protein